MKAIVFDKIGPPSDVLYLSEVPKPEINDNEVLIRMVSASINPGDFLFIQNLYPAPKKPKLPGQIGGNHGAGIVERSGRNVTVKPGTFVAFSYYNTWAEYAAVPKEWLIELPSGYSVEKAGQFVNLITALDLILASKVKEGQWLAITAGYSAVSLMVSQFAKRKGIKVISLVRKYMENLDEKTIGAEIIVDLSMVIDNVQNKIMEITGNHGINGVIDNVGGTVFTDLIRTTAFGSQIIINGGMSSEMFELHNFDILLKGIGINSYVYRYFFNPPSKEDFHFLNEIITLTNEPGFYTHTGGLHTLDEFENAIKQSISNPSQGKRLFSFTPQ